MIDALRALLPRASTRSIGELVELAGPDATVVVASDHGFGPTRDVFHVNAWLEQRGLPGLGATAASAATADGDRRSASRR